MKLNQYTHNFGEEYCHQLPKLGDAMAEILRFFGVKRLYGVGGDYAANLISALSQTIDVLPASNEMHAGFTACGQAEIEPLGVCLTTFTVGSLPCTSAAALAMTEKLPVVFISGAPGESEIGETALHHTVSSCATWHNDYNAALQSFRALGLRAERLQGDRNPLQPNIAAEQFFKLVKHAYVHKEPVFVEVPRDLVFQPTQALGLPQTVAQISQVDFVLKGAEAIAHHILSKLQQAKSPLVYLGVKVKLNKPLLTKIAAFCEKLNIPYTTSWFAKGILDESHPLSLQTYNGIFTEKQTRAYIEEKVDYVLEIGTSIYPLDTGTAFNTGTHKLHHFHNKTMIKGTAECEMDLHAILDILLSCTLPPFDYTHKQLNSDENIPFESTDKIDFHNICQVFNQLQSQDERAYIYLPEIGNSYFASFGLITKQSSIQRSWLTNPWYAAMGTSIPYARAVAEVLKQQQSSDLAIVITGDGGFNFQHNELVHFLRADLNLIIIYMRNNIFHLGKQSEAPIYHCSDERFDIIGLINAYQGKAKRCETVSEFMRTFNEFSHQSGIKLIEIPASLEEQYQCEQIRLLNCYIQARNGNESAMKKWQNLSKP